MAILHRTRTLPALLPRYVERFRCIGPDCADSCCSSWNVTLDKKTYKAYKQSGHPVIGKTLAANIGRIENNPSEVNYGTMRLEGEFRDCSMLEDKMCSVQKHLGETHLSHVCFTYPRMSREFAGQHEQHLTLSCPAAARLALLDSDAFEFVEGTVTVREDIVAKTKAQFGMSFEAMNETRIFCLNLMRLDGLALWQRLAILGVFCESLTNLLAEKRHDGIPALLDEFAALVESGELLATLQQIQPNHASQAMVFATLWAGKGLHPRSRSQRALIATVAKNLGGGANGEVDGELLVAQYVRGLARLDDALQHAPHLLEHYIANEMFGQLFPCGSGTPYGHYLQLVARFGLLRLVLAASCNTDDGLPNADELVSTTQVFCRRFQHDSDFTSRVNRSLQSSGLGTLEKLYGFLRV